MAAAELKLQVGLDLAFFRQQLALLGTTATGYSLPINIDRLGIQKEITKLGKNISNRSYTLQVKTTAKIAEAEVDKLKEALDKLQGKEVGIKITGTLGKIAPKDATKIRNDLAEAVTGGAGKKILVDVSVRENAIGEELRAVRKALNEKITPKNGKILVAASIRNSITNEEAKEFRESVKRKIGNIIVDVTGSADQLKSKEAKGIRTSLYQSIISNGGKIKIPATLTIANSEVAAFQKAVNSQFAGITVKIKAEVEGASSFAQGSTGAAGLEKHLQTQGLSGGNYADVGRRVRLREQLKTQSKAQLLELAKQGGLARYSKLNKDPLIERLVQEITSETAERILGNVQNMLRNAGGGGSSSAIGKMLDTFARGVFHMLGMDPAAMVAAQKQKLLPPSISWPASAATPPSYQGKPGTMLPGAPAPTLISGAAGPFGLLPRTTRAGAMGDTMRMLSQGAGEESPGVLAKTTKARIDEIISKYLRMVEVQVGKSFDIPFEFKKQLNTFSYLVQSLRDAETRTRQMQLPTTMAIGGTAFGSQKLLPTALGDETIKILRDAAHAFLNVMRQEMRAVVYQVGVQDLGNTIGRQAMLPGRTQAPLMLPAAGGTTPRSQMPLHSVSTSSNLNIPFIAPNIGGRQINRGVGVMGAGPGIAGRGMAPPSFQKGFGSPEALAIENAAKQTLRLGLATDIAQRSLGKMNASQIPFIGGLRGVAGELGQATKQVLLYGTAYRALAAITSIPGQILDAAKSQQQYTNGLKVATQETGTFAKELLFVDNVQRAFGLNLETTRTGFTRLYASMAPTGFDSGSIEKLFTGISAATAALQLTPDKAERVIYAFGQMASKGQIMSEELKGQLGDVLPGALAIFAKSAGMSVKEFSKAMEDGVFTGNKFREVFAKVSDELMTRFGTGAQAAGKSLQGLLSTVGGDVQRTLESFAPLANAAAQAILGPLGGSLQQLALSAQIATGEIERVFMQLKESRQELQDLRDSAGTDGIITAEESKQIKAAEQSVGALTLRYRALQKAASDPAIAKQAEDITRFTEELAKAGTFVMNVAQTIGGMLSPVLNFLGGNLTTVIGLITTFYIGFQTARLAAMALMGGLLLLRGISTVLGLSTAAQEATALAGAFNVLGVSATRANIALVGTRVAMTALVSATVIGAFVAGIIAIASAFATMKDRAKEAAEESRRAVEEGGRAASTGMTMGVTTQLNQELAKNRAVTKGIETLQKIYDRNKGKMMGTKPIISVEELARLKAAAEYSNEIAGIISGNQFKGNRFQISAFLGQDLSRAKQQAGQISAEVRKSSTILKAQQRQSQAAEKELGLNDPTPDPATEVDDDAKKANLESYYSLLDDLAKATTQAEVDRAEAAFNHKRDLINAEYDYREARANSFQAKAIAFQKEIFNIVSKQEEEAFRNRNKIKLAAGSVSGLSPAGGGPTGLTSYITGDPSQKGKGYQADHATVKNYHDHLAFATRELAIEAYNKLTAADIKVTEFKGYGKGVTGPHSGAGSLHHQGLAMDVPGYQWGGTGAIGAKEYAGSARVRRVMGIGGQASVGAPRNVPGSEKREEVSQRKTNLLASEARAAAIEKEVSATEELRIATARYTASLLPTAEQGLQNQLLEQKINLTRAGISPSILEAQLTYARQELETNENIRINTLKIEELTAAGGKNSKAINVLRTANAELRASLPVSAIQLLNKAISEQTLALIERTRAAKRDAEDQSRINDLIISGMTRQAAEAKIAADNLRKDYKKALEEATKQVDIAAAAFEVLAAAKRLDGTLTKEQTAEYNRLAEALKRAKEERDKLKGEAPKIEEGAQEAEKVSTPIFGDKIKAGMATAQEELTNLTNVENILVKSANNIGNAFGAAFGQIIDGSMSVQDALGSMFKQIGQDFINMAMEIIAKQVTMIIFGMLMKALGLTAGAGGGGKGLDFATMDKYTTPVQTLPLPQAANGAMFSNGIAKFATGGIVNGPTLFPFADGGAMQMGLMGEAGPEAIMPLQRGADGSLGVRAAMGGNGMGGSSGSVLNMSFETSTINGVEYVSRDQLELAMAQTRRQASRDGANKGMAMTLDKIQQSPQTRRRIGM